MRDHRVVRAFGFLIVCCLLPVAGRSAGDYGLPGEFLNHGAGARPLGMGRAFTAVADDIDALYWNPAGLSLYRSNQVTFQYSPLVLGGAYQYLAYSQPLYAIGNFGVGIVNLDSGDVTRVDPNNVEIGEFKSRETAYMGSYAYKFSDRWGSGLTVKMAEHVMDGRSARGFGLDAGSLLILNDRVRAGVMARNLVPPAYKFATDKEIFPTVLRAGAAVRFMKGHLVTALDVDKTLGVAQNPKWHMGVVGFVIPGIYIRAGLDQTEITGGVGFRYRTLQLDYAAGFQTLGFNSRVSVKTFFGGYEADVKASPSVFSPVGLRNKTVFKIAVANRRRIVNWILSIRDAKNQVVKSFQGFSAPPKVLEWDGRDAAGQAAPPGEYAYRMSVSDTKGRTELTPVRSLEIRAPTPFEIEAK